MNLLQKYPNLLIVRSDSGKKSLNADITRKLQEEDKEYLNNKYPGIPLNQQLYNELIGQTYCKECGAETKFENFSKGYKELCKKCSRKLAMEKGAKKRE